MTRKITLKKIVRRAGYEIERFRSKVDCRVENKILQGRHVIFADFFYKVLPIDSVLSHCMERKAEVAIVDDIREYPMIMPYDRDHFGQIGGAPRYHRKLLKL